ncbi:MAG TPA: FAD-dependent oxidoreductase, partial [Euzebya sp.]|nr:FAD-dependent oxidoreductase [Euzebya sp.]
MHQPLTATPAPDAPTEAATIVIVGNGMVGERLLAELQRAGLLRTHRVVVVGEERRPAYDRVHLSSYVEGASAEDLSVADASLHAHPAVRVLLGQRVADIDRAARVVRTDAGVEVTYDHLVLCTGSAPFVPPIPGRDADGCHVYRTIEDLDGIVADAAGTERGVVIGGGLLGLEAANALRLLGLAVSVVEFAPRLMPRQLDQMGSDALRGRVEELGIAVHTDTVTEAILTDDRGRVSQLRFADGTLLDAQLVCFSAGIRPRDELARAAGIRVSDRGGVAVGASLTTEDPRVHAIGECASVDGMVYGLVGPGYAMAKVLANRLAGGDATFGGADMSTSLKLLGV